MSFLNKFKSDQPELKKESMEDLPQPKGRLAVDFYQTGQALKIVAPVAGVEPEQLDIKVNDGMLIIKGKREKPYSDEEKTFSQECYWGTFVRKIMLPKQVDEENITAEKEDEVLTITLPIDEAEGTKEIKIEE